MTKFPRVVVAALLCTGAACFFPHSKAADGDKPADSAKAPANTDKTDKDAKTELRALINKINEKLQSGKKDESDFPDELKQFDAIVDEHKGEKTDDVASVLMAKASLYIQVFQDNDKATEILKTIQTDYPDTKAGMGAGRMINGLKKEAAAQKIQKSLVAGATFPDFEDVKDLDGKPLSVANYKGKTVLVDFWATWCGPCVGEMPNVIKTYQKYHDKGFEIIGVSLDQDKDSLTKFIKDNNMPWPQYFDGQGWDNKLAAKYGIQSIPMNFLIDKDGKIIDKGLRGEDLDSAVSKAVGQ
ncbi:MAG TPA: TlpA disulfide reductase family protein [Chthoniobacteraceae bacterium]|nr:TlpA disulfide reductase family protein [Chthoniobacteraceae bacterium]